MPFSHLHYLPLAPLFFSILVGVFLVLVVLLQIRALRYAYMQLGIGPGGAMLLLLGSLIGSYFNIPVTEWRGQHITAPREIIFHGMHYFAPVQVEQRGTVIAVNIGGALIPAAMSLYLLVRHRLWVRGAIATLCVAVVCHMFAEPVPGLGIALPVFVPALAAAIIALLLSPRRAAPLAYIGGSLGTLIGADLTNLGKIEGLGAPVASIGGAGTFDGIFLAGVLAVLIASLSGPRRAARTA